MDRMPVVRNRRNQRSGRSLRPFPDRAMYYAGIGCGILAVLVAVATETLGDHRPPHDAVFHRWLLVAQCLGYVALALLVGAVVLDGWRRWHRRDG